MTKKLVETLDTMTRVPTFQELLDAATKVAITLITNREEVEKVLEVARTSEAEQRRALTRMNKCAYFAQWDGNPMEWHARDYGGKSVVKCERLETPDYYFEIFLKTTELKRTPYEVVARIYRDELSTNPAEINGGYRMDSYGATKYGEEFLTTRCKTLAGAEGAFDYWKTKLYKDHAAEIDFCRYLRKLAIADGSLYTKEQIIPWTQRR